MAFSIGNLFGKKSTDDNQSTNQGNGVTVKGITSDGSVIVASKVDWKKEGVNDAGQSKGDVNAFSAGFKSVYARIKKSQELDQALQNAMKQQLKAEIINLETQRNSNETQLKTEQAKLPSLELDISNKEEEINDIKKGKKKADHSTKTNFIIGGIILLFMTIYLFLFYSSTGYSAFFRDFESDTSVQTVMFYGQSIPQAFKEGLFEGFFIIFLPIIFMGLGYVVHQFSVTTKGFSRYLKTISLYALTFAFDFLLAYKISKAIYDIQSMYQGLPPFSLKIALADMDFWIVIFCGFVSYVIWGLLFSFVMQNYDRITNIKYDIDKLNNALEKLKQKKTNLQSTITKLKNNIDNLNGKIKQKTSELDNSVRYDFKSMEQYLADYYQGWISYLALYGGDTDTIAKVYDKEMEETNNWMNGIKNKYKQNTNKEE